MFGGLGTLDPSRGSNGGLEQNGLSQNEPMRRTGRRWRKPMAQFGEKVLFRTIREDGVSSFASRMTQRIFVGHHGRTGAILCTAQNGVVRGKSWTRQTLSDAWESTNWEVL